MLLKKFGFVIVLSTIVSCGTGSSNGVQSLSESSTETKQDNAYEKELDYNRIANYLNYIQYSTSKIIKSHNKVAIDAERFDILNNIKSENLRNDDLIEAYENLLNTLANLEMSKHDRDRLTLDIENRRNNAIWQAASSLGNSVIAAGGAGAATGGTGAIAALAGVIVNTGINYVRTQNEISRDSLKEALEINSSEQAVLRAQQTNLFSAQAKTFRNKESDKEIGLIRENPMNLFTDLLVKYDQKSFDEQNQDIFIAELSDYENKTWTLFQPYHEFFVELYSDKYIKSWNACIAKVKDKKDKSEKECIDNTDHAALDSAITHYNDLIEISKNSKLNIFTEQNPIIKSSSKKLLQPLLTQGNKYAGMVEIVISELERSVVKENPTELSDSRFLIYTAQLSLGNIEKAKDVFSKLERTGTVKKTDRMYYTHHCNIIKDENDFCKNSTEMWKVLDNIGSEEYRKYEDYFKLIKWNQIPKIKKRLKKRKILLPKK